MKRTTAPTLAKLGAVVLAFLILLLHSGLFFKHQPQRGDEPIYLIITQSIVKDGDFDVYNQHAQQQYRSFFPNRLEPHVNFTKFSRAHGPWYSLHTPGIPLLLAPFFAVGGADLTILPMVGISLILLIVTYLWVSRVFRNEWYGLLGSGLLGLTLTFLMLNGTLFPDLALAAIVVGAAILADRIRTAEAGRWDYLGLAVLFGAAPWFHVKAWFGVGALLALAIWFELRRSRDRAALRRVGWLIGLAVLAYLPFEWFLVTHYHVPLPTGIYAEPGGGQLFAMSPAYAIPAMLFDNDRGLLTANPLLLLLAPGIGVWWWRDRDRARPFLLLVAALWILSSTFRDWWGGYSPPGRYPFLFVPLLMPAAVYAVVTLRRWYWRAFAGFAILSSLVFAYCELRAALPWNADVLPQALERLVPRLPWFDSLQPLFIPFSGENRLTSGQGLLVATYVVILIGLGFAGYEAAKRTGKRGTRG